MTITQTLAWPGTGKEPYTCQRAKLTILHLCRYPYGKHYTVAIQVSPLIEWFTRLTGHFHAAA